jgi:tocopherol O-methyltransferase
MVTASRESSDGLETDTIREHYDRLSPLYRTFWGEHIHHGFWRGTESAAEAQENLTRELARRVGISASDDLLDIGCGMGGSALLLAEELGCRVHGISISPNQVNAANRETRRRGLESQATFEVRDANRLEAESGAIRDVVWVVECSEHLFDKPRFIETCAQLLKPGGRLAICAGLAGEDLDADGRRLVAEVCEGMLWPSLGTLHDYASWMERAGLEVTCADDITSHVARTWDLCQPVLNFPLVKTLLASGSARVRNFASSFSAIAEAYRSGAMGYGMLVARKVRRT